MEENQATQLADMALDMMDQPDVAHTVNRIVSLAQLTVGPSGVGLAFISNQGQIETTAVSDPGIWLAEALGNQGCHGPGLDAARIADVLVVGDTARDPRWPDWGRGMADLGWRSFMSVRLFSPERTLGMLNFFARSEAAFGDSQTSLAQIFARHASSALISAQNAESLRAAMIARHVIGQAQGILMERYGVDPDRAFNILRRYSQNQNQKLRAIAEQVILTHRLPD
jgi:GAF domain-containing protein